MSAFREMGLVLIVGNLRSDLFPTQHSVVKTYPSRNMGQTSSSCRGVTRDSVDYRRIVLEPILSYGRN